MCIPLGSSITIGTGKGALLEAIGETGSITAKLADCCAGRGLPANPWRACSDDPPGSRPQKLGLALSRSPASEFLRQVLITMRCNRPVVLGAAARREKSDPFEHTRASRGTISLQRRVCKLSVPRAPRCSRRRVRSIAGRPPIVPDQSLRLLRRRFADSIPPINLSPAVRPGQNLSTGPRVTGTVLANLDRYP